ncbi:hypothetical protein [Actinomycetospora sp. NBRC 106378]|uniref:hypothetical protein n=1 Tax=Actinomycetospora sp. NBRC 106378 TaxID=3032208 RepID=UPI0025552E96|nr:hypothetical protein [Actinomycetospora sp. NBRC 106378]
MPPTAESPPGPPVDVAPRFDPAGSVTAPVARDTDALAEPVAAAVLACPAVSRLSAGPFGTVGTYLPGRRVTGVQITATEVTVRVVGHPGPLRTLEAQIRAAVTPLVPGLPVHIGLDDLDTGDLEVDRP